MKTNKFLKPLLRYHFVIAVALGALFLAAEAIFLYQYFYKPLTTTKTLIEIKQQAALEQLNYGLFDKLSQTFSARQNAPAIDFASLRDVFEK